MLCTGYGVDGRVKTAETDAVTSAAADVTSESTSITVGVGTISR
jgi:hypothetical protein